MNQTESICHEVRSIPVTEVYLKTLTTWFQKKKFETVLTVIKFFMNACDFVFLIIDDMIKKNSRETSKGNFFHYIQIF